MTTMHRAQILLEPEQHRTLSEIARAEARGISEVVREIVRRHLAEREERLRSQRDLDILEKLTAMRKRIEAEHGVSPGDLLAQVRDERDEALDRIARGDT
jgi:hypothetical protein